MQSSEHIQPSRIPSGHGSRGVKGLACCHVCLAMQNQWVQIWAKLAAEERMFCGCDPGRTLTTMQKSYMSCRSIKNSLLLVRVSFCC